MRARAPYEGGALSTGTATGGRTAVVRGCASYEGGALGAAAAAAVVGRGFTRGGRGGGAPARFGRPFSVGAGFDGVLLLRCVVPGMVWEGGCKGRGGGGGQLLMLLVEFSECCLF